MNKLVVISPQKFGEYRRCQILGYFNMLDYQNWKRFTRLTEDEWWEIIDNYDHYKKMFNNKKK